MAVLKQIALSVYKKPSLYLFIFFIIFSFDRYNRWVDFKTNKFPLVDDVDQFYSYLPAVFIQGDLTFKFPNNYWTVPGKDGNKIARTTYGMALMYSPFFFIGHAIAKAGDYVVDGYSLPYKWSLHFGTFFYVLIALWLCRINLLRFFNEFITFITLIAIFLGTNLFYYTFGWGEMCHSYLFFILSLFIFYVLKWFDTKKLKHLLIFSFLAGFATLIRPTDIVVLLFPLLFGITNLSDIQERIKMIVGLKWKLILAILIFVLPIFVQMLYWKVYSGNWLLFTYGARERFFFNDPQIANLLFSFRKGWFIYTPIMAFILIGIPYLKKSANSLFWFLILFFSLNVYILSSWWDWGFGGSFGCRAIIQHYAFFVFGLASFVSLVFSLFKNRIILNSVIRISICGLFTYLIVLNYNLSWKYKYSIVHFNGMTKEAFMYILTKGELSPQERIELNKLYKTPNLEEMLNGKRD
ncbi:MAG: hypothetical protein KA163_05515 [Bacteroidia bacterium]|nr:hypothetical protein [Bacteroidia bacterium]